VTVTLPEDDLWFNYVTKHLEEDGGLTFKK
jgi:alpha-glucosidase (family GH31 glycosyl hydrolase)